MEGDIVNKEFDYVSLGNRIRNARKKCGMTQEQLGEVCDLSTAHIGHIERGTRSLSIESLIAIASVLGVSTDFLLMDFSHTDDRFSMLINSINGLDKQQTDKLYSVIKILAENVDKL